VTFLFTDIEGSTSLLRSLGRDRYGEVLATHNRLLRAAFTEGGGIEIDTKGDSFFVVFRSAGAAIAASGAAQRALAEHDWPDEIGVRVRMGLHTGEPNIGEEGYLGIDVVRAARISAAGHGGQILVSETTRALLGNQLPDGVQVHDLGKQNLKDIQHEHVYELSIDGAPAGTKPLKTAGNLDSRLDERIDSYIEHQLERAFSGDTTTPIRAAAGVLGLLGILLAFFIILLVALKLIFF
jgi:class 3 adenylate cyclase